MSQFDAARRSALMRDLLELLAGRPTRLLPFEAVRDSLKLKHFVDRGILEVPLERIVGSLGRAKEFNRAFLPLKESARERWQTIERLAEGPEGFPPVELYQVGDAYFVVDGHHRISVLRSLAAPTVEAWVKEFRTPVPLSAEASIEEVLLKRGLADLLEATGLTPREPDELTVTVPGGYERLLEHISGHGYYRGLETGRGLDWNETVASWYNNVYRPMIEIIRSSGAVEAFPDRTETDLYLFTMDHLHELRQSYGEVDPEQAVEEFTEHHRSTLPARLRYLWRQKRRTRGEGEAARRDEPENP